MGADLCWPALLGPDGRLLSVCRRSWLSTEALEVVEASLATTEGCFMMDGCRDSWRFREASRAWGSCARPCLSRVKVPGCKHAGRL